MKKRNKLSLKAMWEYCKQQADMDEQSDPRKKEEPDTTTVEPGTTTEPDEPRWSPYKVPPQHDPTIDPQPKAKHEDE